MIKLFEMFSGYGGASFALKKAGIPFKCVGYSEVDKNAIKCYDQNHLNIKNFGDCTQINTDELPDFDLLTGGFPCQDVSLAGKRDLSKGRTNLYAEIIRIASVKKPKYMLLENVKGLVSMETDEGEKLINIIIRDLKRIGYGVAWKVLNSKDHGIPQNRERVWFACKYGGWDFMEFQFPERERLNIFLKDILEESIDEKYFLKEAQIRRLTESMDIKKGFSKINPDVAGTQTSRQYANYEGNFIQKIDEEGNLRDERLANCLTAGGHSGGNHSDMDLIVEVKILQHSRSSDRKEIHYNERDIAGTLHQPSGNMTNYVILKKPRGFNNGGLKQNNQIRRLTPKECFRLMGFLNDEINLDGLSDTAKYKLAGNGWEINVVSKIFRKLFKEELRELTSCIPVKN